MTNIIEAGSGKKKKHAKSLSRLLTPEYVNDRLRISVEGARFGTIDPFINDLMHRQKRSIKESRRTVGVHEFSSNEFFCGVYRDEIAPLDNVIEEIFKGAKYYFDSDTQAYYRIFFGNNPDHKNIRMARLVFPSRRLDIDMKLTFTKKRAEKSKHIHYFQGGALVECTTLHILTTNIDKKDREIKGILIPLRLKEDSRTRDAYSKQSGKVRAYMDGCIGHVYETSQTPAGTLRGTKTGLTITPSKQTTITYHDGYYTTKGVINGVKELLQKYEN